MKLFEKYLKNDIKRPVHLLFFLFVFFNSLKITVFDMILINSSELSDIFYKLIFTFLLMLFFYFLLFKIKFRVFFIVFYSIQIIYLFLYMIYFNYFHSFLNFNQILLLTKEGLGAAADLSILLSPILLIALLDLPIFIIAVIKHSKIYDTFKKDSLFLKLSSVGFCLLLIFSIEIVNYVNQKSFLYYLKDYDAKTENIIVERYGTLMNSIINFSLNRSDMILSKTFTYGKKHLDKGDDTKPKPNFIIIQVESMDSNIINTKYNKEFIMPYLHLLTKQSIYYPYTLVYHKAGGTSDSEFSIINSIEPLHDYPSIKLLNYSYPNSFINKLSTNAYKTVAIHGNEGNYFNRDYAFAKMGFSEFDDMKKMGLKHVGWGAPDKQVFKYVKEKLKNTAEPFLEYTITLSSHGPFTNAELYYDTKKYDDIENSVGKNYFTSMSYTDSILKDFVKFIQKKYSNTYIFILGDHTPAVNTDEYKQASYSENSNYFEFTPIIILTPDKKVYREKKIAASFLDVALTILNASNIPYSVKSDGIDLIERTKSGKNVSFSKIPYVGTFQNRSHLFKKAAETKQTK